MFSAELPALAVVMRHGSPELKAGGRTSGLVVNAGQQAQQAGEFTDVAVERVVGIERINQARFPYLAVTLDKLAAQLSGCISHLLAVFLRGQHAQTLQFFERVVDQVGVFHVHDEADVS